MLVIGSLYSFYILDNGREKVEGKSIRWTKREGAGEDLGDRQ